MKEKIRESEERERERKKENEKVLYKWYKMNKLLIKRKRKISSTTKENTFTPYSKRYKEWEC